MKKFLLTVASALVLLLVVPSAYSPTDTIIGKDAPNFEVVNGNRVVEIEKLKGRYILLSFWSSVDPKSRLANKAYNDVAADETAAMEYVAINLDPSAKVFEEIVKIDGLNALNQFRPKADNTSLIEDGYGLRGGFVSFLINPKGEVVAQDPSIDEIKALVKA